MRRRVSGRRLLAGALLLCGLVGLGIAGPGAQAPDEEVSRRAAAVPTASEDAEGPPGDAAPGAAGIRVHLDPVTGQVIDRPAEAEGAPGPTGLRDRLNTYGGDLIQEPLPGGGFKVDLRGRFRSAVVATIDPVTDEVEIDCVPAPGGPEASDGR